MSMNCVNCGAPPRVDARECPYCGTALGQVVTEANLTGFRSVLYAMRTFTFDDERYEAIRGLRGRFTAGQVRALLALFTFDLGRLRAAQHLVPCCLTPMLLLESADLFQFDSGRTHFVRLCLATTSREERPGQVSGVPPEKPVPRAPNLGLVLLLLLTLVLLYARCVSQG